MLNLDKKVKWKIIPPKPGIPKQHWKPPILLFLENILSLLTLSKEA
jgi:hypothetical protein